MDLKKAISQNIEAYLGEKLPLITDQLPHDVRRVGTCIHKHLLETNLLISEIYETYCIKDHNFPAKFAYHMEHTPKQYIEHHRIEIAKKLLSAPDLYGLTISSIAFETGLATPASFLRLFKQKTGLAPGKWRYMSQNGNISGN